jgi:hypothetical protein
MIETIMAAAWPATLLLCAIITAGLLVVAAINRKKWVPDLETLVTLDSKGWQLIARVSALAAIALILTSQLFSTSYWVGLAIEADGRTAPDWQGVGAWFKWAAFISVSTVSFFVLSVVFEVVSDVGAPMASGLKQAKKKGIPELLLIGVALSIVMSLASKWGVYEDKVAIHRAEAAKTRVIDSDASKSLQAAEATIRRLEASPTVAVADATLTSISNQIADLTTQRKDAERGRDNLPESHSTNRLRAQDQINELTSKIGALEAAKIKAVQIKDDAAKLAAAIEAKQTATGALENTAGILDENSEEITRTGDRLFVRIIRVGLHQLLCFLLPIIAIDAAAMSRRVSKREAAAAKAAETRAANASAFDEFEADFEAADVAPFGGYLNDGDSDKPEGGAEHDAEGPAEDDEGGDNGETK